nr:hypothetical protein [Tanacetum cinerariifolium]
PYDCRVTIRSKLKMISNIKERISSSKKRLDLFKNTVFGKCKSLDSDILFDIADCTLLLGRAELCLTPVSDKLKKLEKNKAGSKEATKVPDKAAKGKAVQPSDKGEKFSVMIRDLGIVFRGQEDSNPTTKLQPTDAEMGQNWYRKSYDYFDGKEKSIQLDEFGVVSNHDNESDSILDKMDVVPQMERKYVVRL